MIISQFLTSLARAKYKRILTLKRDQKMNYHCFKDIVSKNESGKTLRVDLHNQTKKAHLYATNLKQGAHIHQPTAWSVPHTCAQPYHAGSGSHGQLFRPYWGSSA